MKYLLDTDHLSILQRQTGQDYISLSTRMTRYPLSEFAISTLFRGLILLTCNHQDFGKVAGLLIEDWTA